MRNGYLSASNNYGLGAGLLLCSALTGCIGDIDEEPGAPVGVEQAADETRPDTLIEKLVMGDDKLRVTIASVDDKGGTVIAVVAALGEPVPTRLLNAKTAYGAYLAMAGDPADVPDFIGLTRSAEEDGAAAEGGTNLGVPLGGKSVSYLPVNCSLAADGGWFDDLWQSYNALGNIEVDHWYYRGSASYKSTPSLVADVTRSHLCNQSIDGSRQVLHRQRGTYGNGYYQYTQAVPKGHRSYIWWSSGGPTYYDYSSRATRLSDWYTASGTYNLGIIAVPDN